MTSVGCALVDQSALKRAMAFETAVLPRRPVAAGLRGIQFSRPLLPVRLVAQPPTSFARRQIPALGLWPNQFGLADEKQ